MPDESTATHPPLKEGSTFAEYRIVRLLGRGGMGEVYEVEHRDIRLHYALKLILDKLSSRPGVKDRFKREAQVMAALQHPRLVQVNDFRETDGRCWMRMDLIPGVLHEEERHISLAHLARACKEKLDQELVARILTQVLEGLAYAHEKEVVHRDLKPGNILLEGDSLENVQVRISDFGLVRVMGEDWVLSQAQKSTTVIQSLGDQKTPLESGEGASTRAFLGTYAYMSPEQKRGEPADEKSDIYAVGLMAFRLLTGRMELGLKLPSMLDQTLVKPWDELILTCVEEIPSERYASAEAVLTAMEGLQRAITEGQEKRRKEEARRHRKARIEAALKEARDASNERRWVDAAKACRTAMEVDPQHAEASRLLKEFVAKQERLEDLLKKTEQAEKEEKWPVGIRALEEAMPLSPEEGALRERQAKLEEMEKQKQEEEARRAQEAQQRAEEERKQKEAAARKKAEEEQRREEAKRKRLEEEEAEARKTAEEEARKKKDQEEREKQDREQKERIEQGHKHQEAEAEQAQQQRRRRVAMIATGLALALLLAFVIGIPQYRDYRVREANHAAQSTLRNAATVQEAFYVDNSRYTDDPDSLLSSTYGLWMPEGVDLKIKAAGEENYLMEARHNEGDSAFHLDGPGGTIEQGEVRSFPQWALAHQGREARTASPGTSQPGTAASEETAVEPKSAKGRLYVDALPTDAHIRIMNIEQKFHQGIELEDGRYLVEVTAEGFEPCNTWVTLDASRVKGTVLQAPLAKANKIATSGSTNNLGREFVWVPGGCFQMGSNEGDADEKPVHEVCVDGFWMGKHEVTQGQWQAVMGENPSEFNGWVDTRPVEMVSWNDVQAFIRKLNAKEGTNKYRLPTEAEWEYACRSGGKDETYCGGEGVDRVAWHLYNAGATMEVGTKAPNGLGIYDMSGNVWEWCQDIYAEDAYSKHAHYNPKYEGSGQSRVLRGGGWFNTGSTRECRSASRAWTFPERRYSSLGFRLARTR